MLDDGAAGNVFVGRLRWGVGAFSGNGGLVDKGLENGLLGLVSDNIHTRDNKEKGVYAMLRPVACAMLVWLFMGRGAAYNDGGVPCLYTGVVVCFSCANGLFARLSFHQCCILEWLRSAYANSDLLELARGKR